MSDDTSLLEFRHIRKTFGGVVALDDISFRVPAGGTVHALAGENGSGKSTLLGVMSGQLNPDSGELLVDGERADFRRPADAIARGICMVSQETSVALNLTAGENVLLGRLPRRRGGAVDRAAMMEVAGGFLSRLGSPIDPRTPAADLRPDQLQLLEIARALSMDARVLILDEPTSSLTPDEADGLLKVVDELRVAGVTTIFVSHRMAEVFAVADDITVIRDGRIALSGPAAGQTKDSLIAAMLGGASSALADEQSARRARVAGPEALVVDGLSAPGAFQDVCLSVRHGEIVGLAGLEGAGRSELLESLFGERPVTGGTVEIHGDRFTPKNARAAIDRGLAYLPPDRKRRGLVLSMSITSNAGIVGTLGRARWKPPPRRQEEQLVERLVQVTRLKMPDASVPISTLSGGNQQKVALGKWLVDGKDILLFDEPTRGVDVGAKFEIHGLLREAAAAGAAILVSSSENEELLGVCDRILVMARRRIVADVPIDQATPELLTRLTREGGHDPDEDVS